MKLDVVVLVVDDDEATRLYICRLLEQQAYRVMTAANGKIAIDHLQTQTVDMVLLDILMPEVDGYQVLQFLKADPKLNQIPVMMMTAIGDVDLAVRCIELGAEDCLTKPLNPILLRARINAYLERKWLRDQEQAYLRQLQAEKTAAEAAHRAKNAFLANMSHELRTPLNAILGYGEMLQEDLHTAGLTDLRSDVDKICQSGQHLLGLIDGILDLAKIESGRMDLYLECFDLESLMQRLVEDFQPIATAHHNTLVLECSNPIGNLYTDLGKLRQILWNLLDNAVKFTNQGTITISLSRQPIAPCPSDSSNIAAPPWITIRITDTGIGIPADQQQRIFSIFTQVDDSPTRQYGGVGLGLTISQRLCQLLGGSITVESEVNRGSTFILQLPAQMSQEPAAIACLAPRSTLLPIQSSAPASPSDLILVIDDDRTVRDQMVHRLNHSGYRVVTAWQSHEGLRLARELSPQWIILDMLMPDMDSWAVLSALKDDPVLAAIPVIMQLVSPATAVSPVEQPGVILGICDRLIKSEDFKRLSAQLQHCQRRSLGSSTGGNRILSIQPDRVTQEVLYRLLTKEGWQVTAVSDCATAIAQLVLSLPDLILLDLMQPHLESFQFLAQLPQYTQGQPVPVIALLTEDLTPIDRQLLNQGATHLLQTSSTSSPHLLQHLLATSP